MADTDSEVEDYLPEQTGENLALLQLAGEPVEYDKDEDLEPSLNGTEDFAIDTETAGELNMYPRRKKIPHHMLFLLTPYLIKFKKISNNPPLP